MKLKHLEEEIKRIKNFTRKNIIEKAEYCVFRCSGNPYERNKDVCRTIRKYGRRKPNMYALLGMYDSCTLNKKTKL